MGYYDIDIRCLTPLRTEDFSVGLQNRPNKKNKKQKKRGTFNFTVQYIPYRLLPEAIKKVTGLTGALVRSSISDQLATSLMTVYSFDIQQLTILFKEAFSYEVDNTLNSEQLFRTDSMATKLMKNGSKLFGDKWMRDILSIPVSKTMEHKKSVEVDPSKAQPSDDINANMLTLKSSVKLFMDAILNGLESAPHIIKVLAAEIASAVERKFPDKVSQALGGYLFLRFFCPAISAPDAFKLCSSPSDEDKRHMLLVAKVIQSVVNNAPFTSKDPYLSGFNSYVSEMQSLIHERLLSFAKGVAQSTNNQCEIEPRKVAKCFGQLSEYLLGKSILSTSPTLSVEEYDEAIIPVSTAFNNAAKNITEGGSKKDKKEK